MNNRVRKFLTLAITLMLCASLAGCCSSLVYELLGGRDARKKAGTVVIDASDTTLNVFTGTKKELLLQYLAASAEWRVFRFGETSLIDGTIVAFKRKRTEDGYLSTLHGYVSDFGADDVLQTRVMIRLEPYRKGSEDGWIRNGRHDKGKVGEKAKLNIYVPDLDQPGLESYLVLEGEGVFVEIFEQAENKDRHFTQEAVNNINQELAELLDKGFSTQLLPQGSTIISDTSEIIVMDGMQPGIYMVSGYVNPGETGWIFLKVFSTETGQEVMLEHEQKRTVEYIGYSDDPREKFFFNCEAMCKIGDWDHEYPARFELWFVPNDGGRERLLGSAQRNIYGWQR